MMPLALCQTLIDFDSGQDTAFGRILFIKFAQNVFIIFIQDSDSLTAPRSVRYALAVVGFGISFFFGAGIFG